METFVLNLSSFFYNTYNIVTFSLRFRVSESENYFTLGEQVFAHRTNRNCCIKRNSIIILTSYNFCESETS